MTTYEQFIIHLPKHIHSATLAECSSRFKDFMADLCLQVTKTKIKLR